MSPDDLKRFALLVEFSEDEREALADLLEERKLPSGKSVFREGSEGDGLILLGEGRLNLKTRRTDSVIGQLEAPQHLGSASLFSFGKREVTAVADGPCTVWFLPRSGIPRLLDDAPRAAFRLAEAIAGELAGLVRTSLDTVTDQELG